MIFESPRIVLVIEDQPNIINVIKKSLMGMLTEVITAPTGEIGVEKARTVDPDLILLDLALPGMSGWEVLETLKAEGRDVPVVIVTAHGDSATALRASEAGAQEFLTKPFLPAELRRVVSDHVFPDASRTT
ncbi:MAG: response regulator [Acidimicrobiia bacterium]|nr:response regulator [Acidimicrobiia bacterium]